MKRFLVSLSLLACAADDPGRIPNNPAVDLNRLQLRAY